MAKYRKKPVIKDAKEKEIILTANSVLTANSGENFKYNTWTIHLDSLEVESFEDLIKFRDECDEDIIIWKSDDNVIEIYDYYRE